MNYKLTTPCDACPFMIGSGFPYESLVEHASGEFPCHKACNLVEDDENGSVYKAKPRTGDGRDVTPHCAGALIFLEKQNAPHQMMRICERLGMYDRTKLNMNANVGSCEDDYPER